MVFRHFPPRTPARRAGGLLGGRPDLCQFWLSGDRFSCVPNRCRSALGVGRVCECGGLSRKRGGAREGSARDGGACWRAQAAKSVRRCARSAKPVRRRGMPDVPGRGRRAGGWPDVSRKGKATSGWGKRSKGKEGEGRSACPSRDRRRCSSFPIPAQRGGVRLMHAEGIVARGRLASSEGAPSQRCQTGQRETPTTAAGAPPPRGWRRGGRGGGRWGGGGGGPPPPPCAGGGGAPRAGGGPPAPPGGGAGRAPGGGAVGGGGGCRHRAMPPQDAPLQRVPPQRRVTTPPPGTARAPGGGGVRRFAERLSTAGTRSIPAGRSAP